MTDQIQEAKRNLESQLNYGGIFVDGGFTNQHFSIAYEQGDRVDEVAQMRRLAEAFSNLANAVENEYADNYMSNLCEPDN